ncbi:MULTISPECIES: DUF6542 domain-containing protein [unclassified Rhodococcus (in: high G+C Gram-positive bacteria)]|uniref:DUF6542 domain-containing protein n=1 Tax=unclassified Rhodococcus (in: high G+C Gram-positive bacteria) TaxID=192944 RepID=UPI0021BE91D5|nr:MULTISPECIES: DUF6542 domain-containing protein [unclassified Rhodococcus (in: high G+C Gram-positive bacteria)]
MSSPQRARSGVPLDQRSAVPSVPGIPAWGAVAVAVGAAVLGFLVDAMRGDELGSTFAVLYVLGALIAVVAVRHRGLFTAMVQPPLIMFLGVPIAYQILTDGAGTSIKDIVLTVAVPLVDRFPLMALTTLLVLGVGGARLALDRRPTPVRKPARAARPAAAARDAAPRRSRSERPATRETAGRAEERRRTRQEPRTDAPDARHDRTRRARPAAPQPREESRAARPAPRAYEGQVAASDNGRPRVARPRYEPTPYEPRRTGAENLSPYPAPRVRYRDRD